MCPPVYVEFPFDRIVGIHGKKKPPDEPPDPGDDYYKTACGGWYNGSAGGGGLIVDPFGLQDVHNPGTYIHPWFLWNQPAGGFTAEIAAQLILSEGGEGSGGGPCVTVSLHFGVALFRNRDPRTITIEDIATAEEGGSSISFPGKLPTEAYAPIVCFSAGAIINSISGWPCDPVGYGIITQVLIQAHCQRETYGKPPPLRNGSAQPGTGNLLQPWAIG